MASSLTFTVSKEELHKPEKLGLVCIDGNIFFRETDGTYYVFTEMNHIERHNRTGKPAFTFSYEGLPQSFTQAALRAIANDMQKRS